MYHLTLWTSILFFFFCFFVFFFIFCLGALFLESRYLEIQVGDLGDLHYTVKIHVLFRRYIVSFTVHALVGLRAHIVSKSVEQYDVVSAFLSSLSFALFAAAPGVCFFLLSKRICLSNCPSVYSCFQSV